MNEKEFSDTSKLRDAIWSLKQARDAAVAAGYLSDSDLHLKIVAALDEANEELRAV